MVAFLLLLVHAFLACFPLLSVLLKGKKILLQAAFLLAEETLLCLQAFPLIVLFPTLNRESLGLGVDASPIFSFFVQLKCPHARFSLVAFSPTCSSSRTGGQCGFDVARGGDQSSRRLSTCEAWDPSESAFAAMSNSALLFSRLKLIH